MRHEDGICDCSSKNTLRTYLLIDIQMKGQAKSRSSHVMSEFRPIRCERGAAVPCFMSSHTLKNRPISVSSRRPSPSVPIPVRQIPSQSVSPRPVPVGGTDGLRRGLTEVVSPRPSPSDHVPDMLQPHHHYILHYWPCMFRLVSNVPYRFEGTISRILYPGSHVPSPVSRTYVSHPNLGPVLRVLNPVSRVQYLYLYLYLHRWPLHINGLFFGHLQTH